MEEIINGLEPMIKKLSDVFCVSVDAIRESGMKYILMYGEYHYIKSIMGAIAGLIPLLAICLFVGIIVYREKSAGPYMCWGNYMVDREKESQKVALSNKRLLSKIIKTCVLCSMFIFTIALIVISIPYFIHPEIYSIEAVINLIPQNVVQ